MKVFLDDLRIPPAGWILVKTASEAIELLRTGNVESLSLDNDLGLDTPEGHTVVYFMAENNIWPKNCPTIHSANPVRAEYMAGMIARYGPY